MKGWLEILVLISTIVGTTTTAIKNIYDLRKAYKEEKRKVKETKQRQKKQRQKKKRK